MKKAEKPAWWAAILNFRSASWGRALNAAATGAGAVFLFQAAVNALLNAPADPLDGRAHAMAVAVTFSNISIGLIVSIARALLSLAPAGRDRLMADVVYILTTGVLGSATIWVLSLTLNAQVSINSASFCAAIVLLLGPVLQDWFTA